MPLFSIEHSTTAYRADFLLYGSAVPALGAWLALGAPAGMGLEMAAMVGGGVLAWSAVEYLLHRFVLHGLQPFKGWHLEHHQRPAALICAPTLLSASLIVLLVSLPALWLLGEWLGGALALGVLAGYLGYAITHHAVHHWRVQSPWLKRRKYAHARHHHLQQPCCYGVTSGVWDKVLGTAKPTVYGCLPVRVMRHRK